jgi:hypothetical protein
VIKESDATPKATNVKRDSIDNASNLDEQMDTTQETIVGNDIQSIIKEVKHTAMDELKPLISIVTR